MSRIAVVLFCVFLAGLVRDAVPRKVVTVDDGKIVGGKKEEIKNTPYQVAFLYNGAHLCGGSIISSRFILTAAHCVTDRDTRAMNVRVGSNYHATGGTSYFVKRVIIHPDYDADNNDSDIAVLELLTPIRPNSGGKVIPLATTEPAPGDKVLLSGWGAEYMGGPSSWALQSVTVPAISRELCQRLYIRYNVITENMWCAGYREGGKDSCQGDSGGPAVVNGRLAGVVSFGAGCAKRNSPGVYTSVPKFRSWIASVTSK